MNIRERVNEFLDRLYVPKKRMDSFKRLKDFLECVNIRAPNRNDEHKSRFTILLIETKGKGSRETYHSYDLHFVDFDSIGEKYALAYVYDSEGNGRPLRIDIQSPKTILIY